MNSAIERQLLSALKTREKQDGIAFTYGGVTAIGVLGVPTLEAQLGATGPLEKLDATLTVRRAWFPAEPAPRHATGLAIFNLTGAQLTAAVNTGVIPPDLVAGTPARVYFVPKILADDPLAYEFTLIDRG